jgi:uncharacterized protein (UPF0371 family)
MNCRRGFDNDRYLHEQLKELENCEVHMTHVPTPGDEAGLRRLGSTSPATRTFRQRTSLSLEDR